jgi:exodeoxyribonuclease-5
MIKNTTEFYSVLLKKFQYTPTSKQQKLLRLLSDFTFSSDKDSLFLLKGYAGTGKNNIH